MQTIKKSELPGQFTIILFIVAIILIVALGAIAVPRLVELMNSLQTSIGSAPR